METIFDSVTIILIAIGVGIVIYYGYIHFAQKKETTNIKHQIFEVEKNKRRIQREITVQRNYLNHLMKQAKKTIEKEKRDEAQGLVPSKEIAQNIIFTRRNINSFERKVKEIDELIKEMKKAKSNKDNEEKLIDINKKYKELNKQSYGQESQKIINNFNNTKNELEINENEIEDLLNELNEESKTHIKQRIIN
ncbi:hypothetical protein CL6EHI_159780 [Entamoeba histolytica]|uniref:Uncharacterized protein n=5 Tax=Entamoeba histolytica TaxID=5759 RepID=C4LX56_ENTH1|nr:hypothetical protein EHI_159780 [Entamoeba histolytica HM-1:IMSS]EAL46237.1 hypothetical protein EHI_159780 [Entamoeba histolytica HM-1:IMSS]EMD46820.1 Hypothetical protein EHI5A_042050 [Entamoeba histolytica KU27]ENY60005.1 hypothetical protein EHI7A_109210 [Entamoeba histolytica HM-1:IMSS-A]GAT93313.1 hypothetical protein CL6EHI_159780 [Entamoeba histolytica]|eukprot:XP_651624.1 hypothetical protein EHI_159780 [Entamoeba histolytica HM-1:IMSS]